MFGFQSLKVSLLLTWMLLFPAQTQHYSDKTVTVGEDATLTCYDYREFQDKCSRTDWIFRNLIKIVTLYERGKVSSAAGSKSERLSVTEKCSLVIKKVTEEDAGDYLCRQYDTSRLPVSDSTVYLSVTDEKTPSTIKPQTTTTTSTPTAATTTATTKTSTIPPTTTTMTTTTTVLIVAAVGFSALLITAVIIIRWKKTKRNKTQTCDTPELDWNPAGTRSGPETSQEAADPPDVVHYASISYTNNTRARVHGGDHDDSTVTYSTVGAPAAASTDPSGLYATVQKTT